MDDWGEPVRHQGRVMTTAEAFWLDVLKGCFVLVGLLLVLAGLWHVAWWRAAGVQQADRDSDEAGGRS